MKIIAFLSQKGGVGKTTLAIHLAVAAEISGRTAVIIDLDTQSSATSWKDSRSSDTPIVISAQASRLTAVLEVAEKGGADFCIIDTAPHSESTSLSAARAADLILIPCRPAILDLRAIGATIDLSKLAGKPASVILNSVPPRGNLAEEAIAAVSSYNAQVVPVQIVQRAAFMHALTIGQTAQEYEPGGKAADEIIQLYKWTCIQVGLRNDQERKPCRRSA